MLIYHPAFDAYHATLRCLTLIQAVDQLEVDKLRILDFYLIFPAEIANARLPRGMAVLKRQATLHSNPYHGPVNALRTFRDLQHIQTAAARTLASTGLIDAVLFEKSILKRTNLQIPEVLAQPMAAVLNRLGDIRDSFFADLARIALHGPDGLKARSGLLEYRYDTA